MVLMCHRLFTYLLIEKPSRLFLFGAFINEATTGMCAHAFFVNISIYLSGDKCPTCTSWL